MEHEAEAEASTAPVVNMFTVIGDSNVQRNLVDYNCSDREDMRSSQLIPCTSLSTFSGSFAKVRAETTILIISCLSNFLRDSSSSSDPSSRLTETYERIRGVLFPYCESNPDLMVMVAPPQFSREPVWYASSISMAVQMLTTQVFNMSYFPNLHLLPAHPSQVSISLYETFFLYLFRIVFFQVFCQ